MNPHRKIRPPTNVPRPVLLTGSVSVIVLIPVLALATGDVFRAAMDFISGVLTLVSLTSAVIWGLIATDRVLLEPRQRLLAQAIHRVLAVSSLAFLLVHIATKVAVGHVGMLGALVPFGLGMHGPGVLIGLGSLAAYLMVIAGATGAARSAFANPGQAAGRWRSFHALAYPAWGAALVHGLQAGRPAAGWVLTMYSLMLIAVGVALTVRLLPQAQRRRIARLLMTYTRPEALSGIDVPPPARDPGIAPLPGARRVPGQRTDPTVGQPPLRLDSTRPPPISASRGTGISAAYRAVSSTPPPTDPFAAPPTRPLPSLPPPPLPGFSDAPTTVSGPLFDTGQLSPVPEPRPSDTGSFPRPADTGSFPRPADTGGFPRPADTGGYPRVADTGGFPGVSDTGSFPGVSDTGRFPGVSDTGRFPGVSGTGSSPGGSGTGSFPRISDTGSFPTPTPLAGPFEPPSLHQQDSFYEPGPAPLTDPLPTMGSYATPSQPRPFPFDDSSERWPGTPAPQPQADRWPAPSPPPPAEHIRPQAEPDPVSRRRTGPPYPPPPGEPWNEHAGDRP
ncbi:hypothetical protein [Streptomyces sp. NPDC051776]|uniref:hypothetical protein n=1 Tax=Streptomyces sp. NPDC051776 TaxID=3155414 RepID=UPI003432C9A6